MNWPFRRHETSLFLSVLITLMFILFRAQGEQAHVQLERDKLKQIINSKLRFSRERERKHLSHQEQQRRSVLILRVCVDVPHRFTFQRDALIYKRICMCVNMLSSTNLFSKKQNTHCDCVNIAFEC